MHIKIDDLTHPQISALLQEHLDDMHEHSPPESIHALDLDKLRQPNITFWSIWQREELLGCGALKKLDSSHGEIKSMRTARKHLRQGIGAKMLAHIIEYAKENSFDQLSLETGSQPFFKPAHDLYQRFGFKFCEPFDDYTLDPNSRFMTLTLKLQPLENSSHIV